MPPDDHTAPSALGYQPDLNACPSCFLFQVRGGRRCPPAQQAYDLRALQEARNFEALRVAVHAERGSIPSFADLVRRDAEAMASQKRPLALMPGTTTELFPNTNKKEADAVVQQTRTRSPR